MAEPELGRPEEYADRAQRILAGDVISQEHLMVAKVYGDLANAAATREHALATMHVVNAVKEASQTIALALAAMSNQQDLALDQIRRTIKKAGEQR